MGRGGVSFDLPNLPMGWEFAALERCAIPGSISYGVVQPGAPIAGGVAIIRVNNFKDMRLDLSDVMRIEAGIEAKYGRSRLAGGEVLLTLVGSVGQVAVVPKVCAGFNVARAVGVIRPAGDIEAQWIAICLRSPLSQHLLATRANTTVQTTINLKDVRALPIPIPPRVERQQIAEFLYALDDRIALLRETNATLEAIAHALFKSWFVDFDPVRAKQQGLAPAGMDEATAALFPDSFEESALGLVPIGWRVGTLGDVSLNPRQGAKPENIPPEMPYFGLEHMPRRSIALASAGTAVGLESGKFWFERDDVLFGKLRPYFHKVGLAPTRGVCSTDILVVRPKGPSLLGFVVMHASSDALIAHATMLSNGARMPRTSWQDIAGFKVVLPPEEVAAAFNGVAYALFERIYANIDAARALSETRDTLLPRLISGQLRLPESQPMMESKP